MTPVAPRHFAWQAWHLVTFTFASRGRRGTNSHLPSFCVAGVALMVLGGALGPGLGGRDACGAAPLCVAGVALGDIHLRFTWQAWHNSHLPSFCVAGVALMVLGGALGPGLGARDACGAAPLCVAGVALGDIHLRFTWQAWHKLTSTVVLRGNFVTHHLSPHQLSHTSFATPSFTHHLSHTTLSHALFHTHNFHTHTHTIFHTQLCHTHTIFLCHTPSFHIQPCHTQLCFSSRSSTTSFVFPSFPVPATTFGAHYWKKLPCGVIRSFNLLFLNGL